MRKWSVSDHTLPTESIHLSAQRTLIIRRNAKIAIIIEIAQLATVVLIEISLDRMSQTQMPKAYDMSPQ